MRAQAPSPVRLLRFFLLATASLLLPSAWSASAPINVVADPSSGALFRPTASVFASGNGLILSTTVNGYFSDPSTNGSFSATSWRSGLGLNGTMLRIWCIGDSHIEGKVPGVTVSGSEKLGLTAFGSSMDLSWSGTADRTYFPSADNIGVTGGTDPNVSANTDGSGSMVAQIPPMLRLAHPTLGNIRLANCGIGGSSSYSWAGNQAGCYFQAAGQPTAGDTVTIGSVTYTFRASASSANEVTIGGSAATTLQNLCNAINAEGSGFGSGTVVNPSCFCPNNPAGGILHVFAITPGTAGNSLTQSVSGTGIIVWATAPGWSGGSATSGLYTANKALIPAGFGTPDVILVGLGTNDAARQGYRGRGTQAALTTLIATLHSDFPNSKIILWRPPVYFGGGASATALTNTVIPAVDAVVSANSTYCSSINVYGLGSGTGPSGIGSADGVHMSSYGYSLSAQMFARAIVTALAIP